jgi:hypothetical protein
LEAVELEACDVFPELDSDDEVAAVPPVVLELILLDVQAVGLLRDVPAEGQGGGLHLHVGVQAQRAHALRYPRDGQRRQHLRWGWLPARVDLQGLGPLHPKEW